MRGAAVKPHTPPRPPRIRYPLLRRLLPRGTREWSAVYANLVHWVIIAIPIGVVAGLGAVAFMWLWQESTNFFLGYIVGITYPEPGSPSLVVWSSRFPRILLLPLVMGLGGLGAGLLAQTLAPEIEGHGTDEAIRAFHKGEGKVRWRVGPLKMLASALTLGTGGSGGREGPTSQIGSSFGSWWADFLELPTKERRIALAVGIGAGVGAIFKAPLGGAIFAAEIFYMTDFEPEVIFPAMMASVVSYSIFGIFYGFDPLFAAPAGLGWNVEQLPLFAILGVLCAGAGVAFVKIFYTTREVMRGLSLPLALRAGLGATLAGLLVLVIYFLVPWGNNFVALSSINVGYGFVQAIMLGQDNISAFVPVLLIILGLAILLRMLATSFTVGGGGAAGLFGTSVAVGALLGSAVGIFFHALLPSVVSQPDVAVFAIVGMMAFFGGISKAPLAVLVMVVEMVASYSLLIPAMLSIFIAYAGTGKTHLYSEQVETRLDSEAHRDEAVQFALASIRVTALMDPTLEPVDPNVTVAELRRRSWGKLKPILPVMREGVWYGILRTQGLAEMGEEEARDRTVYELVKMPRALVSEEATLAEAYHSMLSHDTDVAVVISTGVDMGYRGLVTKAAVLGLVGQPHRAAGEE